MHELAIAQNLIELVEREARLRKALAVTRVKISVGALIGVAPEALAFSFDVIKRETIAASAELEIEVVKLQGKCRACFMSAEVGPDFRLLCPACQEPLDIVAGRELQLDSIEFEDSAEGALCTGLM